MRHLLTSWQPVWQLSLLFHIPARHWWDSKISLLPAVTKLGHGNIFIGVCQEFCSQGGGVVWSRGGVSNFSGGVSKFGGVSPIFFGGVQFFRVCLQFWGGLQFFGGLQIFFSFFFNFFPPKNSSGMHPPRDGQCAAGTHPTGMHSSCKQFSIEILQWKG